jgi:hypothetical protein
LAGGLTRIANLCNREGLQLLDASDEEISRKALHLKTYKSSTFSESCGFQIDVQYTDVGCHLQISEYAHRGLFLVRIEETIGIPFIAVGSPNLGQAVST